VLTRLTPLRWFLEQTGTGELFFTTVLPLGFVCFGFGLMYSVLTSARIPFRSAVIGGLVGGTLWSAAVYGYAYHAQNSDFYSSVYGSLSAIPVFLLWLYLSWTIVLLGAQVAFASGNISTYREEILASTASQATRELLALRIVVEVAGRFEAGEPPIGREELPQALQASGRLINQVTDDLLEIGCLVQVDEGKQIAPVRDLSALNPADLLKLLRQRGEKRIDLRRDDVTKKLDALSEQMAEASHNAVSGATIGALAAKRSARRPADS
jgi:membrane protein